MFVPIISPHSSTQQRTSNHYTLVGATDKVLAKHLVDNMAHALSFATASRAALGALRPPHVETKSMFIVDFSRALVREEITYQGADRWIA